MLHIVAKKPQDIQAEMLQSPLAILIHCELPSMAFTVNLDHQFQPWAIEVDNVCVNRSLS